MQTKKEAPLRYRFHNQEIDSTILFLQDFKIFDFSPHYAHAQQSVRNTSYCILSYSHGDLFWSMQDYKPSFQVL